MRTKQVIYLLSIICLLLIASGCLQQTKKLGCCVKGNVTADSKCLLFNMSSDTFVDLYDSTQDCNLTSGFCNISIGGNYSQIPICSEADMVQCIKPNCTAMVCGNFAYKPRVAPAVVTEEDISEMVPPMEEDQAVQNFYGAQCRFLPMDSKLKAIMKTSSSSINRFRFGVGKNFDEFEQYRLYFPLSDKFCQINTKGMVDRYMNYIDSSYNPFNPLTKIISDCANDSGTPLPPLTFGSPSSLLPDSSSYKFTRYYRYVQPFVEGRSVGSVAVAQTFERLDKKEYRKVLSSAYADKFYENGSFRAPFECDSGKYECKSGFCDTSFYERGVPLITGADGSETAVPSDCYPTEVRGTRMVICYPTISASKSPTPGGTPSFEYAKVSLRPWSFSLATETFTQKLLSTKYDADAYERILMNYPLDFQHCALAEYHDQYDDNHNRCTLNWLWERFFEGYIDGRPNYPFWIAFSEKGQKSLFAKEKEINGSFTPFATLPPEFGFFWNDTTNIWEQPYIKSGFNYPPAGQIVFFDNKEVTFNNKSIIGYAVLDPGEFENTLLAKSCGIFESTPQPWQYNPIAAEFTEVSVSNCNSECTTFCPLNVTRCENYCNLRVNGTDLVDPAPPEPCNYTVSGTLGAPFEGTPIVENPNAFVLDLTDKATYQQLMNAFGPLYNASTDYYAGLDWEDGCGKYVDSSDLFLLSMPWLPKYNKVMWHGDKGSPTDMESILSSPAHEFFRDQNNIYQQAVSINARSPSLCTLKKISATEVGVGLGKDDWAGITYQVLQPHYVFLLKKTTDATGKEKIGKCDLAPGSTLPRLRTYGWCEPCTFATLAYQQVMLNETPYVPHSETGTAYAKEICSYERSDSFSGNMSCDNPEITDLKYYSGFDPFSAGAPRTMPEATLLKERMGNYLKSGIMPIIDLSDKSNWNRTSLYDIPYKVRIPVPPFEIGVTKNEFDEYDFQRLLGNGGAILVVVDQVSGSLTAEDTQRILERSTLIRNQCWRCLTSVFLNSSSAESFESDIGSLFGDLRVLRNIDVITFGYTTKGKSYNGTTDEEKAESVVNETAAMGRLALQKYEKPTLILGFNVGEDSNWNSGNYETLFTKIIQKQDELVKAGVMGMLYSPIRTNYATESDAGIVNTQTGTGVKTPKFCSLEQSIDFMGASRSYAQFIRAPVLTTANCTTCTSLEKTTGQCDRTCENGVECTLSTETLDPSVFKCPDNAAAAPCKLCNETNGFFFCNQTYVNGTTVPFSVQSEYVNSDMYGGVIGGLKKPNKCCLQGYLGNDYTFTKHLVANTVQTPIVYPADGNENTDCGMSGSLALATSRSFCGAQVPIQDYDIECEFVESPSMIPARYTRITPEDLVKFRFP